LKPVVGWVAGVHLSRIGEDHPAVFNGLTSEASDNRAVVMQVTLPTNKIAEPNVVNVFWPGSGDVITFPNLGFEAKECSINGKPECFAEYMTRTKQDRHLPLMASQNGTLVNLSIQSVDEKAKRVTFYGPVFPGLQYRFASPMTDYVGAFDSIDQSTGAIAFSCNCVLNYLYANLEGKRTGSITGPITFGEIAHRLLNQTVVQLVIHSAE
jgi:hypothetical protein